jgi:hypothetical protein
LHVKDEQAKEEPATYHISAPKKFKTILSGSVQKVQLYGWALVDIISKNNTLERQVL